jgi:cyanophycinase
MAEFDAGLLAATGRRRPRVAILPTASMPDGEETFQRWVAMGLDHFRALGAEVEAVLVRGRATADDPSNAQAVGEADLVYMSGGKPGYLRDALAGSRVWAAILAAHNGGSILAGCSAGAMVLAERQLDMRPRVGMPVRWVEALGVVRHSAVIPHYDAQPEAVAALAVLAAPAGITVLGIDEDTAIVGRDGAWQVHGRGRVTVWNGRHRERHRSGEAFRLDGPGRPGTTDGTEAADSTEVDDQAEPD